MAKAIHSMVRVLGEARSLSFYRTAFGLEIADRLDFEAFTQIYLSNPETEFEVELTINKGRAEPYALGDGYGHLAVSVADLDAECARMVAGGLPPPQGHRRLRAGRYAIGPLLLHRGSRRLQGLGFAEERPFQVTCRDGGAPRQPSAQRA